MLSELDDNRAEEIRDILGNLFAKYGLTTEVIKLSQWVDEIVVRGQKERQIIYYKTSNCQ